MNRRIRGGLGRQARSTLEKSGQTCHQTTTRFQSYALTAMAPFVRRDISEHLLDMATAPRVAWFSAG